MCNASSAVQHDSGQTTVSSDKIPAKPCYDCGFTRQTFARTNAIVRQNAGCATKQEQCRIYALFTKDAVGKLN
jgi:hypothetical protein